MLDFRKLFPRRFSMKSSIILTAKARVGLMTVLGVLVLAALIAILVPENPLISSPEIARAQRRGSLRVGVRTDAPGFAYNGEGLEISLARELAKKIFPNDDPDIMLELVPVTQFTAQARLKNGDIDIAFAMQRADTTSYAFSQPYYYDTVCVIVRPENIYTPLNGKTFAVVASTQSDAATRLGSYLTRTDIEIFSKGFGSYPDIAEQLLNGTVDFAAVPGYFVPSMLENHGLALHSDNLGRIGYSAVSNTDESAFADLAGMVIGELSSSGELDRLIEYYGLSLYRFKQ